MRAQRQAGAIADATLLFHLLTAKGYAYLRDELYYFACSEHLAFAYVDPSASHCLVTWLTRAVLGDSLYALRFFPALCADG